MGMKPGVIANTLIFAILGCVALLAVYYPDLYYRSLQEDEVLEWATFWAFVLATGGWLWAAVRQRRSTGELPWFLIGVGLFCFVVAMEEISWAQRIFAYRPPAYFLEENFQQELNFHNILGQDFRNFVLYAILFGYGVLLPILARIPSTGRLLAGIGIVAPPLDLAPAFAAALILSLFYPWQYTNETVELMMGVSFLFAAVFNVVKFSDYEKQRRAHKSSKGILIGLVLVSVLSLIAVATSRYGHSRAPHLVELASVEIKTLRQDILAMTQFSDENSPGRQYIHHRVYTFGKMFGNNTLYSGEFSRLVAGGLPQERADFFLDPWNAPYWIKMIWNPDYTRATAYVYSYGPDRRRDSASNEILGDDIGAFIFQNIPFAAF